MITSWGSQKKEQPNNNKSRREVKQRLVEFSCDRADVSELADTDNVGWKEESIAVDLRFSKLWKDNRQKIVQDWRRQILEYVCLNWESLGGFRMRNRSVSRGKLFKSQYLHRGERDKR